MDDTPRAALQGCVEDSLAAVDEREKSNGDVAAIGNFGLTKNERFLFDRIHSLEDDVSALRLGVLRVLRDRGTSLASSRAHPGICSMSSRKTPTIRRLSRNTASLASSRHSTE